MAFSQPSFADVRIFVWLLMRCSSTVKQPRLAFVVPAVGAAAITATRTPCPASPLSAQLVELVVLRPDGQLWLYRGDLPLCRVVCAPPTGPGLVTATTLPLEQEAETLSAPGLQQPRLSHHSQIVSGAEEEDGDDMDMASPAPEGSPASPTTQHVLRHTAGVRLHAGPGMRACAVDCACSGGARGAGGASAKCRRLHTHARDLLSTTAGAACCQQPRHTGAQLCLHCDCEVVISSKHCSCCCVYVRVSPAVQAPRVPPGLQPVDVVDACGDQITLVLPGGCTARVQVPLQPVSPLTQAALQSIQTCLSPPARTQLLQKLFGSTAVWCGVAEREWSAFLDVVLEWMRGDSGRGSSPSTPGVADSQGPGSPPRSSSAKIPDRELFGTPQTKRFAAMSLTSPAIAKHMQPEPSRPLAANAASQAAGVARSAAWHQLLASKQHQQLGSAGKYRWLSGAALSTASVRGTPVMPALQAAFAQARAAEVGLPLLATLHLVYEDAKLDVQRCGRILSVIRQCGYQHWRFLTDTVNHIWASTTSQPGLRPIYGHESGKVHC